MGSACGGLLKAPLTHPSCCNLLVLLCLVGALYLFPTERALSTWHWAKCCATSVSSDPLPFLCLPQEPSSGLLGLSCSGCTSAARMG